jgi:hypothetical protein
MIFPSPAGMSLTKLSLGGNYDVIYKLFPSRESLVSDIPAGDVKMANLFLQCTVGSHRSRENNSKAVNLSHFYENSLREKQRKNILK